MAVLDAAVTTSDTTIDVDSVSGFPADPQYELRVGNERMTVVAISGTVLTVVRLSPVAHRKGTPVALFDRLGTVDEQLTGSVKSDSAGLTTQADLRTFDYNALATLGISGHVGPWWADARFRQIINGGFDIGADTSALTATTLVGSAATVADYEASLSADIPYWIITVRSGDCTYARVTDVNDVTHFRVTGTGSTNASEVRIIQDVPVPGQGAFRGSLRYTHDNLGTSVSLRVRLGTRDAAHGELVAVSEEGVVTGLTGDSATEQTLDFGDYIVGADTRYVRVDIQVLGTTGSAIPSGATVSIDWVASTFDTRFAPYVGTGRETSSQQSISNQTWTKVTGLSTTIFGSGGFTWTSGTVDIGAQRGLYLIVAHTWFTGGPTAGQDRRLGLQINGSGTNPPLAQYRRDWPAQTTGPDGGDVSVIEFLDIGYDVDLYVYQQSGGALDLNGATLSLVRLGSI